MPAERELDERYLAWLRQRFQWACDNAETIALLRKEGFADAAILSAFESVRPRGNSLTEGTATLPLIRRAPPNLHKIENPKFAAYTLDDFLAPRECTQLIALIGHHLKPSTLAFEYGEAGIRTSQTAYLAQLRAPALLAVDAKICRTLGLRAEYSEGIQSQRYDVGGQFKPHWDAFEPGTGTFNRFAGVRGNRTWTFMVYLNEDLQGGATRFTQIDHAVKPKTGMALFWNNLNADGTPNMATEHCGEPVTAGFKVIITKWFRVHGDGPVFLPES